MKPKLKIIVRDGVSETNSSSSHAIAISMEGSLVKPGDSCWDLDIRDGVLYIPRRADGDFAWDYFKTNKCQEKLQYVCAIYCEDIVYGQKRIMKLTNILKRFLGVKKVVYEWDKEYWEDLKEKGDPEYAFRPVPEIDHESRYEVEEQICENQETLINFIFNPNSWLFGGNDNSSAPNKFYEPIITYDEEDDLIISIDLFNFGRFDIIGKSKDNSISNAIREDKVFSHFVWNVKDQKMEYLSDVFKTLFQRKDNNDNKPECTENELNYLYLDSIYHENNGIVTGVLFIGKRFKDILTDVYEKYKKEYFENHPNINSNYPDKSMKDFSQEVINNKSNNLINKIDYLILPINVKYLEFEQL